MEGTMNKVLRTSVQELAKDSIGPIREAILGKTPMSDKVKEAIRMVSLGIKVEHMDQIAEQSNRSFALRLIPHLPKQVDKDEYVKATNPQIAPLMLGRPKK
jgi:sensor histidine kinase regulating citrate/malate metabolism